MSLKPEHPEFETDAYVDNDEEHTWLPRTPSATSLVGLNIGSYFDKVNAKGEDTFLGGLTLLDTMETFFDARIDLFERQLKKQRERIQTRATLLAKERREKLKTSAEEYDKELQKFKLKVFIVSVVYWGGPCVAPHSSSSHSTSLPCGIDLCTSKPRH